MQFLFPLRSIYLSHSKRYNTQTHIFTNGIRKAERTQRDKKNGTDEKRVNREGVVAYRQKSMRKICFVDYIFALPQLMSEKSKQLISLRRGRMRMRMWEREREISGLVDGSYELRSLLYVVSESSLK